jgi:hypothetical protein
MPAARGAGRKCGRKFDRNAGFIATLDRWSVFGDSTYTKISLSADINSAGWRYLKSFARPQKKGDINMSYERRMLGVAAKIRRAM